MPWQIIGGVAFFFVASVANFLIDFAKLYVNIFLILKSVYQYLEDLEALEELDRKMTRIYKLALRSSDFRQQAGFSI